jgi:hypothetical protein
MGGRYFAFYYNLRKKVRPRQTFEIEQVLEKGQVCPGVYEDFDEREQNVCLLIIASGRISMGNGRCYVCM